MTSRALAVPQGGRERTARLAQLELWRTAFCANEAAGPALPCQRVFSSLAQGRSDRCLRATSREEVFVLSTPFAVSQS